MKMGLEIHQRLDTHKLFCECPSIILEGKDPDLILQRRLHPVVSELGEIDKASKKEFEKKRLFEYQAFDGSDCLVEEDEEPPHPLNSDALKTVIELSLHLDADLMDEVHVMRKIVIDGSNTSGFQRTAIVSLNGILQTSIGDVRISTIALEEESAGIAGKRDLISIYKLDRLGIPLIEIATEPDIKNPEHVKEVAEKLGALLRSTGKVMRGIGTIRQDVNVSIDEGARVEIKGAQDLKLLPLLVQNEVKRQEGLVKIAKEIKKRWDGIPKINSKPTDLSKIFSSTTSKIISSGLSKGQSVFGLKLERYFGLLGTEFYKGRRYGSELSDYAKPAGVRGILHSDEDLSNYKISEKEISKIKEILKIKENDVFVIVIAEEAIAKDALEKVIGRATILEVPEETRRANPDASTTYMRPLPGKARMYPETDIPPVELTSQLIDEVKNQLSDSLEKKRKKLEKILNKEMAEQMLKSKNLKFFEELVTQGFDPMLIASTLENTLVALRREGLMFLDIKPPITELFSEYKKEKFVKAAIQDILIELSKGKTINQILDELSLHKIKGKKLEELAEKLDYNIKEIMIKYRLQVDPKDVVKLKKR